MIALNCIPSVCLVALLSIRSPLHAEDPAVEESSRARDSISALTRKLEVPRDLEKLRRERGAAVLYRVFTSRWSGRVTGTGLVSISQPDSDSITGALIPGQAWVEFKIVSNTGIEQGRRQLSMEETKLILQLVRQEEVFRLPEQPTPEGLVEDDAGQYEIYGPGAFGVYLERASGVHGYGVVYRPSDSGGPVRRVVDVITEIAASAVRSAPAEK